MITRTKSTRRDGAAARGSPHGPDRLLHGVAVLLIVAATLAAFAPALRAGFVSWDDGLTVTDNYRFRGLDASHLSWMLTTNHAGHYQPLSWLSLSLDHARLGLTPPDYPEAAGFHATSVALHALGALAVYLLALRILGLGFARSVAAPDARAICLGAVFAALFYAVHPLRCESVCWVTERRDVLSAPFFLLAVLAYLRAAPEGGPPRVAPGWLAAAAVATVAAGIVAASVVSLESAEALIFSPTAVATLPLAFALLGVATLCVARGVDRDRTSRRGLWLLLTLLALIASLLAKAWGIVMPALLLVLDVWPLRRLTATGKGESRVGAALALVAEKLPVAALALGFGILARWAQVSQQGTLEAWEIHTVTERVVQALYGLAFYPWKTLLPLHLAPLYPIPPEVGLADPRFLLGAVFTLGVSVALWLLARRLPALLCAWVAYGVIVSPVLGLQQSGPQLVADRYAYLAGIPLALLAGAGLVLVWQRGSQGRRAAGLLAVAIPLLLGVASFRQSRIWHDSETLWTAAHRAAPESPLASLNLGLTLAARAAEETDPVRGLERLDLALVHVGAARLQRPGMPLYAMNEAILRARRARITGTEGSGELDAAIAMGSDAIALSVSQGGEDGVWYWHQGRMLARAGRRDDALAHYERAVALRPLWPPARLALAGELLDVASALAETRPSEARARVDRALVALEVLSGAADVPDARRLRDAATSLRADLARRPER